MVEPVRQSISDRGVSDDGELLAYVQREIAPTLAETRRAVNSLAESGKRTQLTVGPESSGADYVTVGLGDNVAFQDALDAAARSRDTKRVLVLPGIYYVDAPVYVPSGVSFVGSGRGRTMIVVSSNFDDSTALGVFVTLPDSSPYGSIQVEETVRAGQTYVLFPFGTDIGDIAQDEYVMIVDDQTWNPSVAASRRGELLKVNKVGVNISGSDGSITAFNSDTGVGTFLSTVEGTFTDAMIGKVVLIGGSSTDHNNGAFTISELISNGAGFTFYSQYDDLAVDTSGTLTYRGPLISVFGTVHDEYMIGSNARVMRIPWVKDIDIGGFEFYQEDSPGFRTPEAGVGGAPAIALKFTQNARVYDIYAHNLESPGIVAQTCVELTVYDCRMRDLFDSSPTSDYGNGVMIGDACEDVLISDVHVGRCRHGIDSGVWKPSAAARDGSSLPSSYGAPRGVNVHGCHVSHFTDAAFATQEQGENFVFTSCTASNGDSFGFFMRSKGARMIGCSVDNATGGYFLGDDSDSASNFLGAGCAVIGCSARNIRNFDTSAADLSGTGLTGSGGGTGGGNGITLRRVDHCTVENNTIEYCDRSGIRIRTLTTNCVFKNNTVLDCNKDESDDSTGSGIVIEEMRSSSAIISDVSSQDATITSVAGSFFASHVGGQMDLSGFAVNPTNNQVVEVIELLSSSQVRVTFPGAAPIAETGGFWEEDGASYNLFQNNTVANRSIHPTGFATAHERGLHGSSHYGIRIEGVLSVGNMVIDNRAFTMHRDVLLDNATSTVVFNNHGSPEAQSVPIFAPGVGSGIDDVDYLVDNVNRTGPATMVTVDNDTQIAYVAFTSGFLESDVGKTIYLSGFADANNNGRFIIHEYVSATSVGIKNPKASDQAGGTWVIESNGVQDGALSYDEDNNRLYIRNGSAAHQLIGSDMYNAAEYNVMFGDDIDLQPPSLSATYQDCNAAAGATRTTRAWFDGSEYPSDLVNGKALKVYLEVVLSSSGANTPDMQLYNQTDAEAVSSTSQSHTGTTPARYLIGPLTVSSSAGDIKDSLKEYRIQGRHNTGGPSDYLIVHQARFIVRYG